MTSNKRRAAFSLSVLFLILAAHVETAITQGNSPSTQPVTGTFRATPVNVKQRFCPGEDGLYLEIRGPFVGMITSSDSRLSGKLEFMANPALINLNTGFGTFQGPFRIIDPATGAQKAQGEFHNVVTEGSLSHGFAVGKVMNRGDGSADAFFANFKATFDAALNTTGQFGGTGDPRTPAVIQGGHCSGPFDR